MDKNNRTRAIDAPAAALTAAGLALRLASARAVFRGGNILFIDTDDYYHLRRMMTAAANFPRLPSFDSYLGFPTGFHCNWPPLYDWLAGWLMIGANLRTAEIIAAFIPPIAGTITLWLFYKVAVRVVERRAALWALGIAAVLPMPVFYTMLGRPDHHSPENLFFFFVLAVVLDRLKRDDKPSWRDALIPAAALSAGILCWIGSVVFAAILFAFALWELLPRRSPPKAVLWLGEVFGCAAVLIIPFCFLSHWGVAFVYDFDAPSPFQFTFLLATASLTVGLWCYRARENKKSGILMLVAACIMFLELAYRSISSWALFAGAPLRVFQTASEMQPLLKPFGRWSGDYAGVFFGWSLWLIAPLAWLFYNNAKTPARRLILIWAGVTGALALWQTRYAYHFSYPAALLVGFGADRALARLGRKSKSKAMALAVVPVAAVLILGHALKNSAGMVMADPRALTLDTDLIETCDWLREHTPPTRSLWRDEGAPEYGIYALHDYGGPISAIAQRPAAAGNMHVMREQIKESAALFFMESENQAYEFLSSRRFRYVVLDDVVHDGRLDNEAAGAGIPRITARLWDLVYARLYVNDGSLSNTGERWVAPVGHMRLVHESPTETFGVKRFKVFEVVPGAALSGRCEKGIVEASIALRTDQGRSFSYRTFSPCQAGRYDMNLPYAGRYQLSKGKVRASLSVSGEDVEHGSSVSAR